MKKYSKYLLEINERGAVNPLIRQFANSLFDMAVNPPIR